MTMLRCSLSFARFTLALYRTYENIYMRERLPNADPPIKNLFQAEVQTRLYHTHTCHALCLPHRLYCKKKRAGDGVIKMFLCNFSGCGINLILLQFLKNFFVFLDG